MVLNCFSLNCCTPYGCRFLAQKMYTLCTPYVHLHKRNGIFGSFLKRCTFFVHLMYTLMYTLCTPTYNMIYIKRNIIRKYINIFSCIFIFSLFGFWCRTVNYMGSLPMPANLCLSYLWHPENRHKSNSLFVDAYYLSLQY